MSFDLNINNYQKKELEEIFELPQNYDIALVEIKETKLRENIFSDITVSEPVRNQTLEFLQKAKDSLVSSIKDEIFKKTKQLNIYNNDMTLRKSELTSENGSQFIIDRPTTPFAQSFPNEFYPGVINPLKKRYTRQYLNIDTKFRDNYYSTQSTNFHFDLPIKFSNVLSLQLNAFEIETTYYVISKQYANNFMWIKSGTDSGLIIIPDGNYTSDDLVNFLNNYLTSGPLSTTVFTNLQFILNLNANKSGSGQIIIGYKSTATSTPEFVLDFQSNLQGNTDNSTPLPLKFGWLLGFRLGIYENNVNYVSEGIINLSGPKYFYLVIDDYNNNVNNSFYSAFNSSILNKNILARISYSNGNFANVSENNLSLLTTPRQYFGPVDIQKLNIQLLDEYGRIVDLNNMDYSFCLTMQCVYDL
jgi:frataxin-like iron-binding protein CyaY